ncbi:MAG: 50S ribosomal protein L11 methyltransferase [Chloroflexi bacterium]|nr:50S ribosomal protein L11 methyltransferase [Chloroflexota bacterium]
MRFLELAAAVRPQAAEAAADLFRRHVPAGVAIETPYEAIDDEGGVLLHHDRPVTLRAWLPADGVAGRAALAALRRELRSLGAELVRPLRARAVSDDAWKDLWKRHFSVLRIGRRLVVRPSWRRHRARRDDVVIEIDPGMAFGTGQHATTRLCLEALEERIAPGAAVLDAGSGSGILSIAAALLGAGRVDAVDIDPFAVRATEENAARNGVEAHVCAAQGSLGSAWPFRPPPADYDLVLANLSGRLVRELALPLVEALRPEGVALVSGIIAEQEAASRRALQRAGGRIIDMRGEDGWRLLVVARAATARQPRTSRAPGRSPRRAR